MLERLSGIEAEFQAVEVQLTDPAVLGDQARLMAVSRRYKELGPLVEAARRHAARTADLAAARELLNGAEGDDREMLRAEVSEADLSELDGFNQVTFVIRGADAWSRLKYEGGPHRVQRVPVTESQGRIHTSSATVLVLPEAEEVDIDVDAGDLVIDTYRASSAGGQHVNTTDSAVRITHKPTGVVVTMQDERSQLQNRLRAMTVLRSRLLKLEQDRVAAEQAVERRAQVGGGGRSEKIRTYNFKENRVTDHRIGLTLYKLDAVLAGDLDDVVDALATDERRRQLETAE